MFACILSQGQALGSISPYFNINFSVPPLRSWVKTVSALYIILVNQVKTAMLVDEALDKADVFKHLVSTLIANIQDIGKTRSRIHFVCSALST